ncbi:MAG: hypothetical protein WCS92_02065 [Candidatus Babeliales bacterium]|jgi:hypothetical protein|nr:MAG: hypothetical protein US22_C0014G0005 [candidate division TM6 bacterium GW2011_GWF2_36_6]
MFSTKSMKLFRKCVFFAFLLLFPACLHGYFYNLQEWTNGSQTLFLFSDIHKDTTKPYPQRIELIKAAKRLNAFVIVEDRITPEIAIDLDTNVWMMDGWSNDVEFERAKQASPIRPFMLEILRDSCIKISDQVIKVNPNFDPNKDYSNLLPKEYLTVANQHISSLPCLTQFCHQQRIPTKNVEFRFHEILNDVLEMHEKAIDELKSYHDSPILNIFYDKILNSTFNLELTRILSTFIARNPYIEYRNFSKNCSFYNTQFDQLYIKACQVEGKCKPLKLPSLKERKDYIIGVYDQYLIDARILHEIYRNTQYTSIFVCAGGAHIDGISRVLPELGFRRIDPLNIGTSGEEEEKAPFPCVISIKNYLVGLYNILI